MAALPWYLASPGAHNYAAAPWVCLDFETTNLDNGDPLNNANRVVLAAWHYDGRTATATRLTAARQLLRVLSPGKPVILVAHNVKFELQWLDRLGVDTSAVLPWDTMLAEYVIAGNRRLPLGLDAVARRYGLPGKDPLVDALMRGGVCPSVVPERWLAARCVRDVETTMAIAKTQFAKLKDTKLCEVVFTRNIVAPVLADIERQGMHLDAVRVREEYDRVVERRRELEAELVELTGGINMRSRPQLAAYLYDTLGFQELKKKDGSPDRTAPSKTFPLGQRRTDAECIDALVAKTDKQRQFKRLRAEFADLDSRLTKALEFFMGVVREHDGRFFGRFNQTVTQTHRLSSSGRKIALGDKALGVQFQNLYREYKRLFDAGEKDYMIVESDGAQLEFRVAAFLGQDREACRAIVAEEDIHRFTASVLNNCPEEAVTKKMRTAAKADTFKPLYGGVSGTARQKAYYQAFREKYKAIYDTQSGWVATVLREKKLETPWGLVFYWPDTKLEGKDYVRNSSSIFNYPIQSLATADIIPISLTHLFWRMRAANIRGTIINTVHDSAVARVHADDIDKYREVVVQSFLDDTYLYLERVYGLELNVPLGVAITAGTHWDEGEEIKISKPFRRVLSDGN